MPEEMWSKERHLSLPQVREGSALSGNEVNTVVYKTPDYMLSSAQDYRPGESGRQEHIWQATLGPDAVVFTSHPACMSAMRSPAGLVLQCLPRAQWKDVLWRTIPRD
jgi:hypothetical protein